MINYTKFDNKLRKEKFYSADKTIGNNTPLLALGKGICNHLASVAVASIMAYGVAMVCGCIFHP